MDMGLLDIIDKLPGGGDFGAMAFINVIGVITVIVSLAASYVITAFLWQFIGRKAGLDKDWMPFVPFARTIYRLRIVDEAWWRMFFLDGWWLYGFILRTLVVSISSGRWATFATILLVIYFVFCTAYNIYYRYKFYVAHNIKPHLSMSIMVPGLGIVRLVLDYLIAFTKIFPFTGEGTSRVMMDLVNVPQHKNDDGQAIALTRAAVPVPQMGSAGRPAPSMGGAAGAGSVTGLSGMYAGQTLPMASNDEMVIGRDNAFCNLIVDQNAEKVSRKHCGITFDPVSGNYQVTDYSTNGTFIDGGNRLVANMPTTLQRGTIIALGNRENRFKLN